MGVVCGHAGVGTDTRPHLSSAVHLAAADAGARAICGDGGCEPPQRVNWPRAPLVQTWAPLALVGTPARPHTRREARGAATPRVPTSPAHLVAHRPALPARVAAPGLRLGIIAQPTQQPTGRRRSHAVGCVGGGALGGWAAASAAPKGRARGVSDTLAAGAAVGMAIAAALPTVPSLLASRLVQPDEGELSIVHRDGAPRQECLTSTDRPTSSALSPLEVPLPRCLPPAA